MPYKDADDRRANSKVYKKKIRIKKKIQELSGMSAKEKEFHRKIGDIIDLGPVKVEGWEQEQAMLGAEMVRFTRESLEMLRSQDIPIAAKDIPKWASEGCKLIQGAIEALANKEQPEDVRSVLTDAVLDEPVAREAAENLLLFASNRKRAG